MSMNGGAIDTSQAFAMRTMWLRFYEELNDFLPRSRRKRRFEHRIARKASIKDVIESLGVPHTEVELILANGRSVDFAYQVGNGDVISVYPMFESLDISPLLRVRNRPLRDPRFVVDSNLGRLTRYLRLLGFDCLYRNDYRDAEVARLAHLDNRIVLTRDRTLLRRKIIDHGYFVRAVQPRQQISEVLRRFDLYRQARPFSRCAACNGRLLPVEKSAIADRLEPLTRAHYDTFSLCADCGQIYWQGSHYRRACALLDAVGRDAASV